jgi:hypothetical protein
MHDKISYQGALQVQQEENIRIVRERRNQNEQEKVSGDPKLGTVKREKSAR